MNPSSESPHDAFRGLVANSLSQCVRPGIGAAPYNAAGLELIDSYLQNMWTLQKDFFDAMNLELLIVKTQRNRHATIHRLPVELLVYIFQLALPLPEVGLHYIRRLRRLLRVCTHWATMISTAPLFWTVVTTECGPEYLVLVFTRLGNTYPLHVHCHMLADEEFTPILRRIASHIQRWETAIIVMPQTEEGRQYLSAPAPRLRRLHFSGPSGTGTSTQANYQPFDIFSGAADRLEEVKVTMMRLPWDSPILRGLKSLHLQFCKEIGVSNIIAILNDCPDLATLILDETEITVDMQPDPSKAANMIRLEDICFTVRELQGIREVINGFKAPNCQTFGFNLVTTEPNDDLDDFLLTTLAPFFPFFRRTMFKHPKAVIDKSTWDDFQLRCSHAKEDEDLVWLDIYLAKASTGTMISFLRQLLGEGESERPDVRLIIGRDWGAEGLSIVNEVSLYCNVVDLWLGAYRTLRDFGAERTLHSLTRPSFLPNLRHLIIAGDGWDGDEVKAILQKRFSQAGGYRFQLRILFLGRGVRTGTSFQWDLEELPMIEKVSRNDDSKFMDYENL
ncbi:hypothetical protein FRC05_005855 [Tulasnella sp. 425]|nr:hypothetical protein FRC05_005855 [Tulasnella sp. 425]